MSKRALLEAALEIGRRRAALLDRLRRALVRDDQAAVVRYARLLTGLDEDTDAEGAGAASSEH